MNESKEVEVNKVTLSSGKICYFRPMKIKHTELAILAISGKGDNPLLLQNLMTQELVKMLLAGIEGRELKESDKESLDNIFTMAEYGQVQRYMQSQMGDEDAVKKPQVEVVLSGGK